MDERCRIVLLHIIRILMIAVSSHRQVEGCKCHATASCQVRSWLFAPVTWQLAHDAAEIFTIGLRIISLHQQDVWACICELISIA